LRKASGAAWRRSSVSNRMNLLESTVMPGFRPKRL
jgi:hypothetical protein